MTPAYLKNKQLEVLLPGFEPTTFRLAFRMFYYGAMRKLVAIYSISTSDAEYHRSISTSDALSPSNQYFRRSITVQSVLQTLYHRGAYMQ